MSMQQHKHYNLYIINSYTISLYMINGSNQLHGVLFCLLEKRDFNRFNANQIADHKVGISL